MALLALGSRPLSGFAFSVAFTATGLALTLAACGGDDDVHSNGVNDVKKACEIRTAWKNPRGEKCSNCQAAAKVKACGCEAFVGFDGACEAQGNGVRSEASCTDAITKCTVDCAGDCSCIDGCYANAQACREAASALDGCVADVCSQYCNTEPGS